MGGGSTYYRQSYVFSSGTEHTGCCQHVLAELELTAHLSPPPPPQVTDMESMFQSSNFNGTLTTWNTTWNTCKVTTMEYVPRGACVVVDGCGAGTVLQ